MITRRRVRPSNAPRFFGARMNKDDETLFTAVQARMGQHMGDTPSNVVLLHELFKFYLDKAA